MSTPILLPDLGSGAGPVRVSCWLVDLGESVDEGDRLVEVLLPGITFDVAAPAGGVLTRIDKPAETVIAAGDVLGWIEQNSESVGNDN